MRTADVKELVEQVLATMVIPYSEDVIDEVFSAIANNVGWRARYVALCNRLGKDVVNEPGANWIAKAVGRVGHRQVVASNGLTESYSKLVP